MTSVIALWYHYAMKTQVNIRMEQDLKANLEEWAKEESRSLNNLINHLLKCAVVSNGIIRRASVNIGKNPIKPCSGKEKEDGSIY